MPAASAEQHHPHSTDNDDDDNFNMAIRASQPRLRRAVHPPNPPPSPSSTMPSAPAAPVHPPPPVPAPESRLVRHHNLPIPMIHDNALIISRRGGVDRERKRCAHKEHAPALRRARLLPAQRGAPQVGWGAGSGADAVEAQARGAQTVVIRLCREGWTTCRLARRVAGRGWQGGGSGSVDGSGGTDADGKRRFVYANGAGEGGAECIKRHGGRSTTGGHRVGIQ